MNIRYLNLNQVSPEIYSSMWEIDQVIDIKEPTIIRWTADRLICHFWEYFKINKDISKIFTSPELTNIYIMRSYTQDDYFFPDLEESKVFEKRDELGYYIETPDVSNWIILLPDKNKPKKMDVTNHMTLQKILKERNIKTKHVSNDLFLRDSIENKWKKFVGSLYRTAKYNYSCAEFTLTWVFDPTTTNKIRSVAKKENIRIKKFKVDDIGERAVGLSEIYPTLNREEIELEFVNRVSNFYDLTVKNDSLTTEEEEKLFDRGKKRLMDKDWQYKGINDNFGDSSYE
tara:strand:- start:228 stop:1085 length:858 start_codon:yes stop_codon:yes gene_type:complete